MNHYDIPTFSLPTHKCPVVSRAYQMQANGITLTFIF